MPAPLRRAVAPIGRAVILSVLLSAAFQRAVLAQNQGGMVPAEPSQAGAQYQAKPKNGNSAQGNAAAGDAAAHPAAQPAPGPAPPTAPPPNPPLPAPTPKPSPAGNTAQAPAAPVIGAEQAALIKRGEYVARASDCAPCHMAVGGTPYTGGLILNTPFGQMSTPNITPDRDTGIGSLDRRAVLPRHP